MHRKRQKAGVLTGLSSGDMLDSGPKSCIRLIRVHHQVSTDFFTPRFTRLLHAFEEN